MKSVDSSLDNTRKHSLRAVGSRVDQYPKNYRLLVTNHKIARVIANAVKVVANFQENGYFACWKMFSKVLHLQGLVVEMIKNNLKFREYSIPDVEAMMGVWRMFSPL